MKQTAVEWVYSIMLRPLSQWPDDIWAQAKEMEKEQIKDAFILGELQQGFEDEAEHYYNKTFKSNE
jgi:hypothetical protein